MNDLRRDQNRKPEMNYEQTINYIFGKLPMYQRIGGAAYKTDLHNTVVLCNLLGNPQRQFRSVHIAGTNGKGSVSHLTASVLQEAGYKTGLYTSPHYKDFRERIRVNGKMIPKQAVTDFILRWKNDFEQIGLSFFEMTVGLAFDYFVREKVDIAVIETGLGGRLDSTNVITPLVSVITNIGMDHMRFLGNTLSEIAAEKAGIIKPGIPVVIGETQQEIQSVFIDKAAEVNAPITFADMHFSVALKGNSAFEKPVVDIFNDGKKPVEGMRFPLQGSYQIKNLITTLATLDTLSKRGYPVPPVSLKAGLEKVVENTGFRGRWQILKQNPLVVADGGHNADGIRQVVENIRKLTFKKLRFVFGVVNDKALDDILKLLPAEAEYYFCKADIPRGLDAAQLCRQAEKAGLTGKAYSSVAEAYQTALKQSNSEDLVVIGGSIFVVAEVI